MDGKGREEEASKDVNMLSGCSSHHRRSQSASDRNLDLLKHGVSHCRGKECNQSQDFMNVEKSRGTHGSVYHDSSDALIKASPKHRNSLENDIKQLQVNLHQERSIRTMLERAIGRASSTLSPGHRHFSAQTRELIAEIELLEEEIAHREQHVLSLYRSIFEQCVSGPSSAQSSGMASPAHTSNKSRKHPSIISSAFCSSKKFPLQSFNILPSKKESEKCRVLPKPKTRHESLSGENLSIRAGTISADARKLPNAGRSCLARTLKDHLHQCPNKISEEMVQCMASIYCWMRSDSSEKTEKARSPFLSRSSTSVVNSRRGNGDEHVWSNKCTVEISSISADKNHLSNASQAISSYRLLVEQLERVDLSVLETEAKLAFWINIYNALIMHSYLAYGIPHSALRRMALFHKAAYNVGGHIVTVNSIEHSLLCCRTPRIGRWFESILSTTMRKSSSEEKQLLESKCGLFDCEPLVFFALSTGASSDPMLRLYTEKNVIDELDKATKDFLQANVVVKKSKRVYLPKIVDRYAKGASLSCDQLLTWISENVDDKLHDAIQKCLDSQNKKKASQIIEWLPYNTRFRYVFAKNLTEKTWWV
ncbi:uncharacterized protein LOC109713807 isoform X2 [Ananas comosus]|uniref:Uncharacterized protein LOC109713807 isoform X2 n=1 Tax=Ananas comosus TaxID=4615 RepID=A0A199V802_ANACO|nr:uncharacterized protein LOC109713807 isoform X2 [Ananas comosus]XP_020093619.1 uncharacterized protein LOC109713807 isoform X2 [Ananas comosus]XP_020093620.1 uncharacterized protein LOC109713807 isoform X2 [Ananas comosus]OAY73204.1 hypothetical protein ACMD2_20516 [Ananas comosus]